MGLQEGMFEQSPCHVHCTGCSIVLRTLPCYFHKESNINNTNCLVADDYNRVVLNSVDDTPDADYINASYVDVSIFLFACAKLR